MGWSERLRFTEKKVRGSVLGEAIFLLSIV